MNKQLRIFKVLNIFAFIAMGAVNVAAQTLPLGGMNTAQISALYPTLLTPVGLTFSIWTVIYLLMGWFVIRQTITGDDQATEKVGWLFALTCALNIAWIISWHYQFMLLATVAIVTLWVCLLQINMKIKDESWLLKAGFSVYYAWITVATAVQIFIYLALKIPAIHLRQNALTITILVLAAMTILGLSKIFSGHDSFFGLTIDWAIVGIFLSHVGSEGYNKMYPILILVSGLCALILSASLVISVMKNEKKDPVDDIGEPVKPANEKPNVLDEADELLPEV